MTTITPETPGYIINAPIFKGVSTVKSVLALDPNGTVIPASTATQDLMFGKLGTV